MQSLKTLESLPAYARLWDQFQLMNSKQRLPHAFLFTGLQHAKMNAFAYRAAAAILCSQENTPCGTCQSCRLLEMNQHPDLCYLQPEKSASAIKIDQVRALHPIAYTSPQLGNNRVVIIHPANKMNVPAANALLKLLEEPPDSVSFILITEQLSSLLPTIVSRCQQWRFPFLNDLDTGYLAIAENYSGEDERGKLFSQLQLIIDDLLALVNQKTSFCGLAGKWANHELGDLLWVLYLLNAQMIDYQLRGCSTNKSWAKSLLRLSSCFKLPLLFKLLDQINAVIKSLKKGSNVNQILVLENLLLAIKVNSNA